MTADPRALGTTDEIVIRDVPEHSRYEARVRTGDARQELDGVGVAAYARQPGTIVLLHTEVPPSLGGRGVGQALARYVLEDARRGGLAVVPHCPFIAAFIRRHWEYADLVPEAARGLLRPRDGK